jgi:hypothetical protein
MSHLVHTIGSHLQPASLAAAILVIVAPTVTSSVAAQNCPATPTVNNSPCFDSGYYQDAVAITAAPATYQQIVSLPVGTGSFAIWAKLEVTGGDNQVVACRLSAAGNADYGSEGAPRVTSVADFVYGSIALNLVRGFASPGTTVLACFRSNSTNATVEDIRISALKLGTLINRQLTPASVAASGAP